MVWLNGLETYFGPLIALIIFIFIIYKNKVIEKRIRVLFFMQVALAISMMVATWLDSVFAVTEGAYIGRSITSFLNFALSPCCPLILIFIYKKHNFTNKRNLLYLIPEGINIILCFISIFTGWIFKISPENTYARGAIFILPFLVSLLYIVILVYLSSRQDNRPDEKVETILLISIVLAVTLAYIFEVSFSAHFLIWSTVSMCTLLYYMELIFQAIMYDPLTGVFSRAAYANAIVKGDKREGTLAIVDLNNLKQINDQFGHNEGDKAIRVVTSVLLRFKSKDMRVYRYGGDEFVILSPNKDAHQLELVLAGARQFLQNEKKDVDFSYGIAEFEAEDQISEILKEADERMYQQKSLIKTE